MWWERAMLDEKKNIFRGKVVRRTIILYAVASCLEIYCPVGVFFHFSTWLLSLSLLFSWFFFSHSKLQPPCWCILKMIIRWDWASVAEHAQGSLITPAVIDKNKRSGEGRRGERQEFHWATTKNTVKSSPPPPPLTPSTAAAQPACREDSSILISPWERVILRHIDHSLLTSVINSDNSELNEKFHFCLSVPLLLHCIWCPPCPTLPPLLSVT